MGRRLFLIFLLCASAVMAQDQKNREELRDSISSNRIRQSREGAKKEKEKEELTIKDYKIISHLSDTTHFDTTLTVNKEYNFNYLRRDEFELLPFSNVGQPYNKLAYDMHETDLFPQLGARAKHYNYWEVEDVYYYNVPTPTTELFFKTVMEQGQSADGFFTLNTSRRFNFSIANKGLRSLGKYQNIRTSIGNFRLTANYSTENGRYGFKAHIVSQDVENQENGGITNRDQFESGDSEFTDRSRIDVAFQDAENLLVGKRYYLDHYYNIYDRRDSLSYSRLQLKHKFNYETKFYRFDQTSANSFFGDSFQSGSLIDRGQLRSMFNQLSLNYSNNIIGAVEGKAIAYRYNYFFRSVLFTDQGVIPSNLRGEEYAIGGSWIKNIGRFQLRGDFTTNVSGELGGTFINASASYDLKDKGYLRAKVYSTSRMPNFNFLLYQSNYEQYNWNNTEVFENEEKKGVGLDIRLNKWFDLEAEYSILDNYSYFGSSPLSPDDTNPQIAPFQSQGTINYLKVKLNKEFRVGKFALNNTVMYQMVDQDENILNVPEFVTRNTLYFSDHLFKKALYLQTGVTFKYFTAYFTDGYNPLISEFYSQDQEEIGDFPLIDFFINVKVRRTRIYLKAEHFNSPFTGNNFYSAPDYPYRDFIVRFGLVWNFFI
ncbi:hypothetical protein GWK08_16070 [Leptobacterium flavescens]|uniref:Porin n=1 Tax=Leptobacterium flavescens TaxID=472055 RepID=A0A6P0UNT4_9FLAO|nr:putative porin [Leptobacterium flavescens]NER14974.1 hypothetical protein [Leptobacterium flavescens]